jgi:hypothetical protein
MGSRFEFAHPVLLARLQADRSHRTDCCHLSSDSIEYGASSKPWLVIVIRTRLSVWMNEQLPPRISMALADLGLGAALSMEGEKMFFENASLAAGSGYVRPVLLVEFGACPTGEPRESRLIDCAAAPSVAGVVLPAATARLMRPERTF